MKNALLVINVVLLVAVGILFYLYFSAKKTSGPGTVTTKVSHAAQNKFAIACFEMDSLTNSFEMIKDVKNELRKREEAINSELSKMEKAYRDRATYYQKQAPAMNQQQSESATRDMMQLQQAIQNKKQTLEQEYQDLYMRKMKEVKTKVEEFLKDYNKSKGYSYIISNEPGFIYYRDTVFDITEDVVKGLNALYSKKNRE
ncbi:MAG: OmpH family outer membrane protein [Chitinophagaceae bacterium]|nr:OmpH family outer membrane protein [Chitinophagaceae bacterium]